MLATERFGSGPRVVFVHGFTQTRQSWRSLAEVVVGHGFEAVLVDLPGHGDSSSVDADLETTADLLVAAGGTAVYVGYSLGGRVSLAAAVRHRAHVTALALVGATPGLRSSEERAARRAADERLADHLLDVGVEQFLAEWTALPLFGDLRLDDADLDARRTNTATGLAASLRRSGTGTQEPLWDALPTLDMPVLALAGTRDLKFSALATQLAEVVPHGRAALVDDADHAAHLQQPGRVLDVLVPFLQSIGGPGAADGLRR